MKIAIKIIYAIILDLIVRIGFMTDKCLKGLEPEYEHEYFNSVIVWIINYPLRRLCQLSEEIKGV